jgi:hypothetical protein
VTDQAPVRASTLGARDRLNSGANGTIWALRAFRLPSDPGPLVFKEYRGDAASESVSGLQSIVLARMRLPAHPRKVFDDLTVWPLRTVVDDGGAPVGVLMYLINDTYMEEFALPSGKRERSPREIQHLIFDPSAARMRGVAVPGDNDPATRLAVCEQMAYAMSIMHGANLIYGDLSARNVLYRLRPTPSILLVDCDAARVRGSAAVNKQQNSPDWDPPEGRYQQSQATDRYKLALFVLRCLTPGRGSSVNRDPAVADRVLDGTGRHLMRLALTGDPGDRPRAREWLSYLRQRIGLPPLPARVAAPAPAPYRPKQLTIAGGGWKRGDDGVWVPA